MIVARRAFSYRFKRRFRTTKRCARVIGRLENISLTFIFDYLIRQTYCLNIIITRQFLFSDQVYFSRLSEKSVKNFVEIIWVRLELKLFAIPTDFMG